MPDVFEEHGQVQKQALPWQPQKIGRVVILLPHLRQHFTFRVADGSSSGSGALWRAGWAVVGVDEAKLKAAAFGAEPIDVLPAQTSRDGEDYAAAMAGTISVDPLKLHTNCAGTIATINGPKCKE